MSNEKTHRLGTEATTSSPADTDRVMVYDSSGALRPVTFDDLKRLVRESIQVGVNLVSGGGRIDVNTEMVRVPLHEFLIPGDVVTLSVDCVRDADTGMDAELYVDLYTANDKFVAYLGFEKTSKARTVTIGSGINGTEKLYLHIYSGPGNQRRYHKIISGLSLVRGTNAPLQWTPAPEDIIGGGNLQHIKELRVFEAAMLPTSTQTHRRHRRKISFNHCLN